MKKFILAVLLLALLSGCAPAPAPESPVPMASPAAETTPTPTPEETPTPTPEPPPDLDFDLEPWQTAYIQLLREDCRKEREKARKEETDSSSVETDYVLYDIDKDGVPELFVRYWEAGRFYFDVYTCPFFWIDEPLYLGYFYGGRVASNLYSWPGDNGILSEATRADPIGETHLWKKFTLADNSLEEIKLLDELLSWEGNESYAKSEDFAPGAELLELISISDLQPILDYPASNLYGTNGESVELSRADFSVYDPVLSPQERETLADFLPVLTGKEMLIPDWNDGGEILLTDWFNILLAEEPMECPSVFTAFALCDLDGDGAQELILWIDWYGDCYTILHREKGTVYGTYMSSRCFQMLQKDGVYSTSGAMANRGYCRAFFENGRLLEKELGHTFYSGSSESDIIHYFVGEKEATEAEFEAWLEETLVGDAVWYAAREKALEPWQAAYRDILLHPEAHQEFYALTDEDIAWFRETRGDIQEAPYIFSLYDLDGNGIPELLIGIGRRNHDFPHLLLNILRWNEEAGTVEDMDGSRAYGLLDILWFYKNGYIGTANCVSDLYAIFWKIEDEPDHYWHGYLRGGTLLFDSDETEINGSEFFDMLGEEMDDPVWQEATAENIRHTLCPTEGEEAAP